MAARVTSRRRRGALAIAVGLAVSGCSSESARPAADADTNGSAAAPADVSDCEAFAADGASADDGLPALRLPCLAGGPDVFLNDLGDRPVLVNLWASWCGPCREEMPLIEDAYARSGDRIGFLGVNTEDPRSAAVSLLADLDVTFAHLVDPEGRLLTELGLPGLPVTLAVAADGRVIDRQVGQLSAARLDEMVAELTAGAPTP
jgi:thiol-disulfide isomerase/thioredoxin